MVSGGGKFRHCTKAVYPFAPEEHCSQIQHVLLAREHDKAAMSAVELQKFSERGTAPALWPGKGYYLAC